MTEPPDATGEWITLAQATARLAVSISGFQELAGREGIEVRRRGSRPGVRANDVDRYIESAQIRPTPGASRFDVDYLGLVAAAEAVGVRYDFLLDQVHRGTLPATRSGLHWYVRPADLDQWLRSVRLSPGDTPVTVPIGGTAYSSVLEAVLTQPGWSAQRVATAVGVTVLRVEEWRQRGVPNSYLQRLRALLKQASIDLTT